MSGTDINTQDYDVGCTKVQPDEIVAWRNEIGTKITAVTGTYQALVDDGTITGSGTFTITLPLAASSTNKVLAIVNIGTGVITMDGSGAETMNGLTTITLPVQWSSAILTCNGTTWYARFIQSSNFIVEQAGDTYWVGAGSGLPYGHIYDNGTIAVTIADTTPVEVGDTFVTGPMNICTFGASHYITAVKAGTYKIDWTMSIAQNSPSALIQCEQGIMIDGTANVVGRAHRTIANSTDTVASSGTAIITLTANQQVSLYVANLTNATNIDVEHANLNITMIGG